MVLPIQIYSREEYLSLEIDADGRSEYHNGEIIPMSGGTPNHNEIVGALTVILRVALKGKGLQVFASDQRLWIPQSQVYTYPDLMVVSRPIQLQEGRKDTVIEPIFIGEVLSNSTKNYDRGEKFVHYRTISSFQEYLLIDQSQPHVEKYVKQELDEWLFKEYHGLDARVTLSSLGVEFGLSDLYEDVC